jgi:hypothetical protein
MRTLNVIMSAAAMILVQAGNLNARDIYRMQWQGTAYRTDSAGHVVKVRYTEKDIIRKCAQDNGIANTSALAYVYVANEQNTEVVWAATGQTVCEVFQFEFSKTDVSSADGTRVVRQAFIFDEGHGEAVGTILGGENSRRNANGDLIAFSYSGRFQFAFPETGTVFAGVFVTGKRIRDTASP